MATWPTTPPPHSIDSEPIRDPAIVGEYEGGYEVRRSRWHRHRKEFVLTYHGIQSGDSAIQALNDITIIESFIIARRFQTESFTFVHPYYPSSVYVARYNSDVLPKRRLVRTTADSGADVWAIEVPIREIFP